MQLHSVELQINGSVDDESEINTLEGKMERRDETHNNVWFGSFTTPVAI